MFVTTTESIEGVEITQNLGEVTGLSANTKSIIGDTISDIKDVFGGQMKTNINLMYTSKDNALEALIEKAKEKGADAIIGLRYQTIGVNGGIGFIAYGTAVKVDGVLQNNENDFISKGDGNHDIEKKEVA